MNKINLIDYFATFQPGSTHHIAAVYLLEARMPDELLLKDAEWVDCFNAATDEEYNK